MTAHQHDQRDMTLPVRGRRPCTSSSRRGTADRTADRTIPGRFNTLGHAQHRHATHVVSASEMISCSRRGQSFGTLGTVDWVDLLIIGLMLLAAVHGLRLGRAGPAHHLRGLLARFPARMLSSGSRSCTTATDDATRSVVIVALVIATACGLRVGRPRPRAPTATSPCADTTSGHVDAVLGVGRGRRRRPVVGLARGCGDLVAQQPLHVARCGRRPLRHPSQRRPCPPPGAFGLRRSADLPQQPGLPPGLLDADPALDAVGRRRRATPQTRSLADPAVFSTVKVLGTACNNEQEGSGFVVGQGLVATNAHVVAGEGTGQHAGARRGHDLRRDAGALRPLLRPRRVAHRCPARARRCPSARALVGRGTQAALLGYPEDGPLTIGPAGVTERDHRHRQGHLQQRLGHPGRLRAARQRAAGQLGRPADRAGWPGHRRRVLPFDRLPDVGYALTSPGVLARVQEAALHRAAVSTGPCIAG